MLEVKTEISQGVVFLRPRGRIDPLTVDDFERELERNIKEGRVKIILDCSELEYISSAGLGVLIGHIEEIREKGGDLVICCTTSRVYQIFDLLGFTRIYRFFPDIGAALRVFVDEQS